MCILYKTQYTLVSVWRDFKCVGFINVPSQTGNLYFHTFNGVIITERSSFKKKYTHCFDDYNQVIHTYEGNNTIARTVNMVIDAILFILYLFVCIKYLKNNLL